MKSFPKNVKSRRGLSLGSRGCTPAIPKANFLSKQHRPHPFQVVSPGATDLGLVLAVLLAVDRLQACEGFFGAVRSTHRS